MELSIPVFLSLASLDQFSPEQFMATVRTAAPNGYQLLSISTKLGGQASHMTNQGATFMVTFHIDW